MKEKLITPKERNFTLDQFRKIFYKTGLDNFFPYSSFDWQFEEDDFACCLSIYDKNRYRWFFYKLRDRKNDGPTWKPQPLTSWPYNSEIDCEFGKSVERSRYQGNHNFPLSRNFNDEQSKFIVNPFENLPFQDPSKEKLRKWFTLWESVVNSNVIIFPGQFSTQPFPSEISQKIFNNTVALLRKSGYEYLTSVPTYLHVALSNLRQNFRFQFKNDEEKINQILSLLPINSIENRKFASWLMVFQFWAELVINSNLKFSEFPNANKYILYDKNGNILTYPLRPNRNLWMTLKL